MMNSDLAAAEAAPLHFTYPFKQARIATALEPTLLKETAFSELSQPRNHQDHQRNASSENIQMSMANYASKEQELEQP